MKPIITKNTDSLEAMLCSRYEDGGCPTAGVRKAMGANYKLLSTCLIKKLSNSGISSTNLAAATIGNQR